MNRGPHRLPVLAIAAWVAAASAREGNGELAPEMVKAILTGLEMAEVAVVLIGWPTVILGPVDRFRALALAALGRTAEAEKAITYAGALEEPLPGLHADAAAALNLVRDLR